MSTYQSLELPHIMQVSSARLHDTFRLFQTYSARAQAYCVSVIAQDPDYLQSICTKLSIASYLQIKLSSISDVALNLIVADSFCLASLLTGDKAD